jgi:CHAT domain-containing protein
MSRVSPGCLRRSAVVVLAAFIGSSAAFGQDGRDPNKLLEEAERLAWLKAWSRAAPLYAEAERLFAARGDHGNALYAQINGLRGRLPRLPVAEVSEQLADYLENPLVKADERLRLRCLVIKGEVDEDLDPQLAERSWSEAVTIAERLGEPGWANRAKGELGVVAFLQGDVNASVIQLGQALKVAESAGDALSVVRWLTLFGHGYIELARPEEALSFYERALKVAASVPELQLPVMTYLGKGDALTKLGRLADAEQVLVDALEVANAQRAFGYQAELTLKLAVIAQSRQQADRAAALLAQAADFAQRAGGNRILAEIALARGRLLRSQGRAGDAARILEEGVAVARAMQERMLLPRLLAELADLRAAQRRYTDAANLLEEGTDLLEGVLTKASSPWVQGRIINGARELFAARVRLEGARGPDAARLFSIVEQARGRALLELLLATPIADVKPPASLHAEERRIASLQVRLFHAKTHAERQKLLDQIFVAEEQLAPLSTALFEQTRRNTSPRRFVSLREFQRLLRPDELFLEFALGEPRSYVIVVSRGAARVQSLPARKALRQQLQVLLDRIEADQDTAAASGALAASLLGPIEELSGWTRVIVSPDGELHRLPFELLPSSAGRRLIETHVFSYVPSGSVLAILRERQVDEMRPLTALAVSASPEGPAVQTTNAAITRSVFDVDSAQLRPLLFANDEARSVATLLGPRATLLLGDAATEPALKRQPLADYRVLHFAVHGVPSTRFPARSALLVRPAEGEDGLLQAREILALRLRADLVTLSACDTGSGSLHEQEGVTSLVRPFLAAGARSVVANLWAADDRFSLSLMRAFYEQLANGIDVADALRQAKLRLLEQFGSEAVPRLWSGVLVHGDGVATVVPGRHGGR